LKKPRRNGGVHVSAKSGQENQMAHDGPKQSARPEIIKGARKTVAEDFMLKEYESIAAAHFDSQAGLRQQFRFYLLLAAVPLTILGIAFRDQASLGIDQLDILMLPRFLAYIFLAVGTLGRDCPDRR